LTVHRFGEPSGSSLAAGAACGTVRVEAKLIAFGEVEIEGERQVRRACADPVPAF